MDCYAPLMNKNIISPNKLRSPPFLMKILSQLRPYVVCSSVKGQNKSLNICSCGTQRDKNCMEFPMFSSKRRIIDGMSPTPDTQSTAVYRICFSLNCTKRGFLTASINKPNVTGKYLSRLLPRHFLFVRN